MPRAFDTEVERPRWRLSDDDLSRAHRIVDSLRGLTALEGFLLLKEIRLLRAENAVLRDKVNHG